MGLPHFEPMTLPTLRLELTEFYQSQLDLIPIRTPENPLQAQMGFRSLLPFT